MNGLWTRIEWRITFIYAVFGGLWIFLSDRLVVLLVADPLVQYKIQNYKGWFFVLASALLLYITLANALKRQREAETRRQESQERFQKLFETSLDGILLTAPDGSIFAANPAACKIFGRTEEEILRIGRNGILDVSDPRLALALEQRNHEGYFSGELTCLRKDGTKFPGEFSSVIFVDRLGQTRTNMLIRDITERKLAEEEVHRLNRELEKRVSERTQELLARNKELETFTYTVSHDLKAPLRGIDGYSKLLLEDHKSSLNTEGQLFLSNIREATEQMNRLIEDLLQYSRLERRELSRAVVDLDSLITTMISERESEINLHKIKIDLNLTCRQITTDMDGLIFALRNLLDNAIKFTAHVRDPRILISTREQTGFCILCMEDNGIGFDMKYKDKIFEIFQRLHRAEDYPGTGIGLAIVRKVMERIGGRAWAESESGKGSKFYLEIPL